MIGAIFRRFIFVLILAGLGILFFYAFIAALIIMPILLLLFFLFGRKVNLQWTVIRPGQTPPHGQNPGQGPVIDHDPDALLPSKSDNTL
jgi:hypothetical protein